MDSTFNDVVYCLLKTAIPILLLECGFCRITEDNDSAIFPFRGNRHGPITRAAAYSAAAKSIFLFALNSCRVDLGTGSPSKTHGCKGTGLRQARIHTVYIYIYIILLLFQLSR